MAAGFRPNPGESCGSACAHCTRNLKEKKTEIEPPGTCEYSSRCCETNGEEDCDGAGLREKTQAKNLGRPQEGPVRIHEGTLGGEKSQRKENTLGL